MLNKTLRKIAKKAGFVFWGNESWGPGKNKIDWSAEYGNEFDEYNRLLREKIVKAITREFPNDSNSNYFLEGYDTAMSDAVVIVNDLLRDKDQDIDYKQQRDHLQAKLDSLMFEYCPEDMTIEQKETWAKNQWPLL